MRRNRMTGISDKVVPEVRAVLVGRRSADREVLAISQLQGRAVPAVLVDQVVVPAVVAQVVAQVVAVPAGASRVGDVVFLAADAADLAQPPRTDVARLETHAGAADSSTATSHLSWTIPRSMPNRIRSPVKKHPRPLTTISAPLAPSAALSKFRSCSAATTHSSSSITN